MKGKIYKNKLNTTTSPLITPVQHLNTQISSINPPYSHYLNHPQSPVSQILSPKTQHPQKSFIYQLANDQLSQPNRTNNNNSNGIGTFIDQLNHHQFVNGYQQQRNTYQSMKNNGTMNNILTQMNSPHQQKLNSNRGTSLKRVLSNPNIGSYQFLGVQENREEEIDSIDEASILDKSVHSNYSKLRPSLMYNNAKNGNNQFNNNLFDTSMRPKTPLTNTRPISHLPSSQHQFTTTSPLYNNQKNPTTNNNPLVQTSNLMMYPNPDSSLLRPNQPILQTDYITQYEKRHKQRVAALESQHELEVQFFEEEIRGRDETIEEMRKMLKEKEEIIKRLQADNANLSSRSYISFANGNSCGKD